jgi:flagellum-specific ATP synthase
LTQSISRLASSLVTAADRKLMGTVSQAIAQYEASRDLLELGAYKAGANASLDQAIRIAAEAERYFTQAPEQRGARREVMDELGRLVNLKPKESR